jgi:MoaA/NifB/PqqE/SkfB family radical SAM enzyme
MCYYHGSLNQKARLLSIAEYKSLATALPNLELLLISGGEPFLRSDLVEVIESFYHISSVRTLFIPTNGSLPTRIINTVRDMLSRMPDLQLTLMLSLEGLNDEHDRIHGQVGAFESVVETIRHLVPIRAHQQLKQRPPLAVLLNSVVSNRNLDKILPLMRYARQYLPVNAHTFSPMRGRGPAEDWDAPSPEEFEKLTRAAQPYFEAYLGREPAALKATLDRYALWLQLIRGEGLPYQCQAGNYIGVIEPDGGVRLCELTPLIGNLRESDFDFDQVWFSTKAEQMREQIQGCSCTHACFINASLKFYATHPA